MDRRVIAAFVVLLPLLAAVPLLKLPAFYETFLYLVLHWIVLATSWNILSGYSGYFSFGHGAFFGVGIYTTAVRQLVEYLDSAGPGVYLSAVPVPAIGPTPSGSFYLIILALAALMLWVAYWIYCNRLGSALFAIHDDEDVAEVQGVPTYRYKLVAFGISCGFAGMAGGIHSIFVSYVTVSEVFNIVVPLNVVLMSVLGGSRHWFGPAVGATIITALLYAFTAGDFAVAGRAAIGLILIVVILFMPNGVMGQVQRWWRARATPKPLPEPLSPPPIARQGQAGDLILSVEGITKQFTGVRALSDVSLQVRRGEILGLVGPNGSGKSTMVNVISGLYKPEAGRVIFNGTDLVPLPSYQAAHAGIARTYQIPRPFPTLSVLENATLAGMFGGRQLSRTHAERQAMHWLEFVGLADRARALPTELNLHQRKFLELARALASAPQLVLLDEVLAGLTPSEINSAITLVREIRNRGSTVVFIEHNMRAVLELCERLIVLNYGQIIASGDPRKAIADPEVIRAYLGTPHEPGR